MRFTLCFMIAYTFIISTTHAFAPKPNIIIIIADDLGWYDVSIHGQNQFYTPNIDSLGMNGIMLNRHYVMPLCTPSRSALMTGRDGYQTGMFNFVIDSDEPWGMPLNELTLPQVLKDSGYDTHLVGKWHLGYFKSEYALNNRGFDTFDGYLGPYIDYWDHSLKMDNRFNYTRGLDMRNNLEINYSTNGTYATDLFNDKAVELINQHDIANPMFLVLSHLTPHAPLQAPQSEINKFNYIEDPALKILAAMISKLDYSVGQVVKTLKERCMLDNSVILFMADNGAPTIGPLANYGSNFPLRGQKDTPWEGANRGAAAIFSPLLKSRQRISNQYIHITDWFKTFAELAGIDTATVKPSLTGFDVWDALSSNTASPRTEIVENIDSVDKYASYINGPYKYIEGTTYNGRYDGWFGGIQHILSEEVTTDYATEIRNSEVSKALSQYVDLTLASDVCPAVENQNYLPDATITNLRNNAIVKCAGPSLNHLANIPCAPIARPCLFDIIADPCEQRNLALVKPKKLLQMKNRLNLVLRPKAVPALNKPADAHSNPLLHNNTWTYWQDASSTRMFFWRNKYTIYTHGHILK